MADRHEAQRDELDEIVRRIHHLHGELEQTEERLGRMPSGLTLTACQHARDAVVALDKLRRELVWQIWDDDDG